MLPYERFVRGQLTNSKKTNIPHTTKSIQQDPTKEQPTNITNQTTLKTSPVVNNERLSRVPVTTINNAHAKESRDGKDIPDVTGSMSRNSLKSTVVKVKPNGALPPYSVSIQSTKKESVTPSTIIVTKSVDVPVSTIHSSQTPIQRSSPAPVTKSVTPVTQKQSTVTPDRTSVTQYSSHVIPTSNTSRSTPVTSQLWKKTYVTTNNVTQKHNAVIAKQEYVTKKQEYVTQKQEFLTKKQNHMIKNQEFVTKKQEYVTQKQDDVNHKIECLTQKQGFVTQKKDYVTQKQEYVTQKKSAVIDRHQTKELPSPTTKQTSQTSLQEQKSPALDRTTYSIHQEEQIQTRSSKLGAQDNTTHTKYLTISETYDLIHARSRKRSHEDDKEETKKTEDPLQTQDYVTRINAVEPVTKRRKTPSPCVVTPQRHYVSHTEMSRKAANTESLIRNDDIKISNNVASVVHSVGGVTSRSHEISKEPSGHVNKRKLEITEQPKLHIVKPQPKELVDLTEVDSTTSSVMYQRTSPLYTKMSYSYNNHEHVTETSTKTDLHHDSYRRGLVTPCQKQRDYRDESSQQNGHATFNEQMLYKPDKQVEVERHHINSEVQQRTLSQRSSVESPDAHFQEWRRRQGISQYPAYITTNEPRRRPSITEQLHPQTSPIEHRYVYVQNDNGLHPRVIEEVPLIISSKPGMYYPDESFYAAVPFYHAGWPAAGVTETLPFKGDPETLRNNNHLHGSSCVFMPTSQMFSSTAPIAPISPPIMNQGHMTAGPDGVHQHCVMTSPYQHMIATQAPTRPLHSFT